MRKNILFLQSNYSFVMIYRFKIKADSSTKCNTG